MGPIIAFKGEIIARDFMVSYPSGEPAWKPGIKIPDGSTIGMRWGGDITPYIGLASWLNSANSPRNVQLVLPFIPCSRQDKTGPVDGDQSEGINFILSMLLQAEEVTSLVTLDNHSPHPIDHWRGKAVNLPLASIVAKEMFPDVDIVVAPDYGAVNRAFGVSNAIGFRPVLWATKLRDQASGKILSLSLESPALTATMGADVRNILVVDDIIDGGYTFNLLGGELHKHFPEAHKQLLCTHGVFSTTAQARERGLNLPGCPLSSDESPFDSITTTDSCSNAIRGWNTDSVIHVVERLTLERSLLHA